MLKILSMMLKAEVAKLRRGIDELKKESESKKNRKFQTRCIQISKEILHEEYRPLFLNGLELDAFFQNIKLLWRCKRLRIGFIALACIKMSKNSRTSLIVIGKKDG